jgi:hypothetical protein
MIQWATAIEFVRAATNGRTGPLIMICETANREIVEIFCKLSAGCEQGVVHLAREAVSVCLAADLGLPVPVPYFVDIPPELAPNISDPIAATRISGSVSVAFGSKRANQFSAWTSGNQISNALLPTAAAALVFDGIIQNPDRRVGNPNCLVKGGDIRLIDHELAFAHRLLLLWRPPWVLGGLQSLTDHASRHIFLDGLIGREIDYGPITTAWTALSDERLKEYGEMIPAGWNAALPAVHDAVRLIADARSNIGGCVAEVRRILT